MGKSVCIIGGGISGLCTAYRLQKRGFDVTLFEKGGAVGGNIRSEAIDGFLIEYGPNSTLVSPHLLELITELGLDGEIASADPSAKKRYIMRDGKLAALPMGFGSFFAGGAFSTRAKIRLLKEPFVRSGVADDETISSFFARRLGREIADYAVDPFISGIFAGDPEKLSMKNAFPKVFELERAHGSLAVGAFRSRNGEAAKPPKNLSRTISFKRGMQTLTDTLAAKLGEAIRTGVAVEKIEKDGRQCLVNAEGARAFDALVIATPARAAGKLIAEFDSVLASRLAEIYYPPIAVVFTAFRKQDVRTDLDGFGFLIPKLERRRILGGLWSSSIFENRAPEGYHLMTTFIGGARDAGLTENPEEKLLSIAVEELDSVLGLNAAPVMTRVKKWERAIPQYNIGYEKVVGSIEEFKNRTGGIFFCSNFYKGISVSDCIKNSISAADEVSEFLGNQDI